MEKVRFTTEDYELLYDCVYNSRIEAACELARIADYIFSRRLNHRVVDKKWTEKAARLECRKKELNQLMGKLEEYIR